MIIAEHSTDQAVRRLVAIDWSGAKGDDRRHSGIAIADWRESNPSDDKQQPVSLSAGHSREDVIERLLAIPADQSVVVGFDFAFSFPEWFARRLGSDVISVWKAAEANGEEWLQTIQPPFWSLKRPASDPGEPQLRATARNGALGTPKSVFQLVGNGQVGPGSVRGMKYLARLHAAGFSVWPFDHPSSRMIVEIYPTACYDQGLRCDGETLARRFAEAGLEIDAHLLAYSPDARDAAIALLRMIEHRRCFATLSRAADPQTLLEGRIWRPGECCVSA